MTAFWRVQGGERLFQRRGAVLPLAFPNAYVSTDDPPGRSWTRSALCILGMVGVGYLGGVILVLSLVSNEYSPVTQVASDYGVGTYGTEMNSAFFLAGVGVLSLAAAILFSGSSKGQKAGAALLVPAGLALVVNAFFQTDIEGAATTLHGTIHAVGGVVYFFASPVGLLLISRGIGKWRFRLTLLAFIVGVAFLAINGAMSLGYVGLGERVMILFVFSSLILTAVSIYRVS
jgi:hypothetical membrane protein